MEKIKFLPIKEQDEYDLDDTLIPYIHIIGRRGEFTLCGQAITEYKYDVVDKKIDCPHCIAEINHVKEIIEEENK